jgi:NAD(P)-dependent dehydrogenase (short-subunit alcohol dehydrogenase family)
MRTVAITGAASGIGRAIAEAFVGAGDRVYVSDVRREPLDELVAALGGETRGAQVDVSDFEQFRAFVATAQEPAGRLDVMINAAGVFDGYAGVLETSSELWRRVLEINLTGCFYGCKVAAEVMTEQRSGRIINVGSVASFRGSADGIAYTAAKHGMLGMTRRLAIDVGRFGVTANLICPGVIPTSLRETSEAVLGELSPDQQKGIGLSPEIMDFLIPARRKGTPEEVAAVAIFLASDGASYVNGQALAVDGGWLAV